MFAHRELKLVFNSRRDLHTVVNSKNSLLHLVHNTDGGSIADPIVNPVVDTIGFFGL